MNKAIKRKFQNILKSLKKQHKEELIALFSIRDTVENMYSYYVQPLAFSPKAMEEANGETQLFLYELGFDEKGSVPRIAIASIPAGEQAFKEMEEWILPKTINSKKEKGINCRWERTQPAAWACWIGGCSYYPEVYEYVCDEGPIGNDDGGDGGWNWPEGGGGGDPGGGGGSNPDECRPPYGCEEETEEEPCNTGIPEIDAQSTQDAMKQLWAESNYQDENPTPENYRKERGGYIIPTSWGYNFQKINENLIVSSNSCVLTFKASNVPSDAIFVHSHPYNNGEYQTNCFSGKRYIYSTIPAKTADVETLKKLGFTKGIAIDAEAILLYNSNGSIIRLIERCGY